MLGMSAMQWPQNYTVYRDLPHIHIRCIFYGFLMKTFAHGIILLKICQLLIFFAKHLAPPLLTERSWTECCLMSFVQICCCLSTKEPRHSMQKTFNLYRLSGIKADVKETSDWSSLERHSLKRTSSAAVTDGHHSSVCWLGWCVIADVTASEPDANLLTDIAQVFDAVAVEKPCQNVVPLLRMAGWTQGTAANLTSDNQQNPVYDTVLLSRRSCSLNSRHKSCTWHAARGKWEDATEHMLLQASCSSVQFLGQHAPCNEMSWLVCCHICAILYNFSRVLVNEIRISNKAGKIGPAMPQSTALYKPTSFALWSHENFGPSAIKGVLISQYIFSMLGNMVPSRQAIILEYYQNQRRHWSVLRRLIDLSRGCTKWCSWQTPSLCAEQLNKLKAKVTDPSLQGRTFLHT